MVNTKFKDQNRKIKKRAETVPPLPPLPPDPPLPPSALIVIGNTLVSQRSPKSRERVPGEALDTTTETEPPFPPGAPGVP